MDTLFNGSYAHISMAQKLPNPMPPEGKRPPPPPAPPRYATRIFYIHNAAIKISFFEYIEAQFILGMITSGARHEAATRLCSLAEIATKPANMLLQDLKSGALAFADDEKSKS